MAREKFQTLTEQMFYILLVLRDPLCGVDCMARVRELTGGRISLGPGTLYTLFASFEEAGLIEQTSMEGRKRTYAITGAGRDLLREEYERLHIMAADYDRCMRGREEE